MQKGMVSGGFSDCSCQRRQHKGPQSFEMLGFTSWQTEMLSKSSFLINRGSIHTLAIGHMVGQLRDRLSLRRSHSNGMETSVYSQRCLSMDISNATCMREVSIATLIPHSLKRNPCHIAIHFQVQGR